MSFGMNGCELSIVFLFFFFLILEFELLLINLFPNVIIQCIMNIRQMFKQPGKEAFSVDST